MEFSKLSASEKMAVYASVVVVILAIYSLATDWGGLLVLPLLGGLAVLAIIFLPQMSPNTSLPGSRASLLLIAGGVSLVFWVIAALTWINWIFGHLASVDTLLFLVGLAASAWLAWLTYQAFQGEGGKFVLGSPAGSSSTPAAPPPAPAPPAAPPAPPAAPPAAPAPPADGGEQGGMDDGGSSA